LCRNIHVDSEDGFGEAVSVLGASAYANIYPRFDDLEYNASLLGSATSNESGIPKDEDLISDRSMGPKPDVNNSLKVDEHLVAKSGSLNLLGFVLLATKAHAWRMQARFHHQHHRSAA